MNRITLSLAAVAAAALCGSALAMPAHAALEGHELAGQAKVSLAQARQTALKARPGVVTDQELEKEGGGSGLRYSFDIKNGARTYEVGVDAKSGAVLENGAEGANPD